ncbi:hypothetical protein [Leucobacter tardus]|nr:hypothetical protein [Leucobacter tardus]
MRDVPTVLWLLIVVIAAFAHRWVPAPRWLMIHLTLLGAVTHAILVWSQYFSFALLRSAATRRERRAQNLRLVLANTGASLVMIGVPTVLWMLTITGATLIAVAASWHGASLVLRARRSLAGRFGHTVHYSIAAAALLVLGVALGGWLAVDGAPPQWVMAHALVNVLGWIGLTVAGTIVTLWPTILGTRAEERAPHGAALALPVLTGGVVIAAA